MLHVIEYGQVKLTWWVSGLDGLSGLNQKSPRSWSWLFKDDQPTHTLIVQFTGHRLATWRLTRCDNFMTTPDTLGPAASSQVYGPTENSCFFRWPPLLWTGQNLQVCSDAYRKRPASWQPKSLLITIEQARRWFNSKISWLFFSQHGF